MRVYLTGFMGAGKTTAGRLLAERLGVQFVDLDAQVEACAGSSVARIFEQLGEKRFRQLEAECLRQTADEPDCVVATGGGTPVDPANRAWMRSHGRVVWLDMPFERIARRLATEGERPLFRDRSAASDLFAGRRSAYEDCDVRIDAGDETPEEMVVTLVACLALR